MTADTPDYERFAHEWGNGTSTKIAIGFDWDEQLVSRFRSLDWEDTHCTYEEDYQFLSDRDDGAQIVDAAAVETVRERTGLGIPIPQNCPINPHPFPDGSSTIETRSLGISELSRECLYCESDSVLSAFEFERVYNRADGLRSELLLDSAAEPTHICTSCEHLFVVPQDTRSEMAKAMGEPA